MSHSAASTSKSNGHSQKKEEFASSGDDDDDDEPIRAPIQLKIEFVNSIMFRQWALAKKLCQFMLMYEPNNSEAKQYAPLIEYMLAQEQEGSSSSSSDDSSDDDDDDDSDASKSSSSSSENEEDQSKENRQSQTPKPVNASFTKQCTHHQ